MQRQRVDSRLGRISHLVLADHLLGHRSQMMRLEGFGNIGTLRFAYPERAARMLVNELGKVVDAVVDSPKSFGLVILPLALLPTVHRDQR